MAECEWAVMCDYAFQDSGGKLCIIGIFDRIYAPNVPAIHPQAVFVARLRGTPGEEVDLRIEIMRPTGASLTRLEGKAQMSADGGAGVQLRFAGLNLPDTGTYQCNVYLNGDRAWVLPFDVVPPPGAGVN